MKKEVVYSLLAAAAFPGVAQANVTIKDAVNINQWQGAQSSTSDSVYVAAGGSLTKSLGTYVQGTYKLTIGNIDASHGVVVVSAAGQTKETAAAAKGQTVELEFTLTEPTEVTITVASKQGQAFSIGATKVEVVGDFYTPLNDYLTTMTNGIRAYGENGSKVYDNDSLSSTSINSYITQTLEIAALIESLNNQTIDYDTYKDNSLYEVLDADKFSSNKIVTQLAAIWNAAATEYNNQVINTVVASTEYKTAVSDFGKLTAKGQADAKSAKDKLDTDVNSYKTDASTASTAGTAKDFGYATKLDGIKSDITKLQTAVNTAKAKYAAEDDAHKAVNDSALAILKIPYTNTVISALPDSVSPFGYEPLKSQALKVVSNLTSKITAIQTANDNFYTNDKAAANKDSLINELTTIARQLADTTTYYTVTLKANLDAARTSYNTEEANLNKAVAAFDKDIVAQKNKEKTALDNALTALSNKISTANSGDCKGLENLDITAEVTAVENAITAFKNACQPLQDKANAVANANKQISNLTKSLDEADTKTVSTLKYGTETAETKYWPNWKNNISNYITKTVQVAADSVASNSKLAATDGFYTGSADTEGTLANLVQIATDSINTYSTLTVAAANNYNDVDSALIEANDSLTKAYAAVKDLDIYTDNSQNHDGYNYETEYKAAKKAYDNAVAARRKALAKLDWANADAVKALTYDKSAAVNFAKVVNEYAQADQSNWKNVQDSLAAKARQRAANSVYSTLLANKEMVADSIASTNKPLGLATDSIETLFNKIAWTLLSEDSVVANADEATAAAINKFYQDVNNANTQMDELLKYFNASLAKVKANAAAKEEAVDAVDDLDWATEKANIKKHAGDSWDNGTIAPKNEKTQLEAKIDEIDKAIDKINADIAKADSTETLAEGYGNIYNDSIAPAIENAGKLIDAADELAQDFKKNYDAVYNTETGLYANKYYGGIAALITDAKTKAIAADADAGDKFYAQVYVGNTLQKDADGIKARIDTAYQHVEAGNQATSIKKDISSLETKLKAVEKLTKANLKAYKDSKEGLQKLEADATDTWNEQSTRLAAKDESSKRNDHQNELAKMLRTLNNQIVLDSAGYYTGQYDGTNGNKKSDYVTVLTGVQTAVKDSVDKWLNDSAYNEQIVADNNNMLSAIGSERDKAYQAYQRGVAEVEQYRNLTNATLQAALKATYDEFNNQLRPVPNDIDSVYNKAAVERANTKSGEVFDKDSIYVNYYRDLAKTIVDEDTAFITKVKQILQNEVGATVTALRTKVTEAQTTIDGYTLKPLTKSEKTNAIATVDGLVAAAEDALNNAEVNVLDESLNKLTDIDSLITEALNAAAKLDLEQPLKDAETDRDEGIEFLTEFYPDYSGFESWADSRIGEARRDFDAANTATTAEEQMAAQYSTISNNITSYNATNNPYHQRKGYYENYERFDSLLKVQQAYLDSVKAKINADGYYAAAQLDTLVSPMGFNLIQDKIDGTLRNSVEKLKTRRQTTSQLARLETQIKAVSKKEYTESGDKDFGDVETLVDETGELLVRERDYVGKRLAEFTAEYNKYAAQDIEAAAPYKAFEDSITKLVNAADSASKLLPYEQEIKAKLAELISKSGSSAIAEAESALTTNLGKVTETANSVAISSDVETYLPEDYQSLTEAKSALESEIEKVAAEISNSTNKLYDQDKINAEIVALQKEAEQLASDIKTANDNAAVEAAAEKAAQEKITQIVSDVKDVVNNSKTDIQNKFGVNAGQKYATQYGLCDTQIANMEEYLADAIASNKVRNRSWYYSSLQNDSAIVQRYVDDILNNAAYQQMTLVNDSVVNEVKAFNDLIKGKIDDANYARYFTSIGRSIVQGDSTTIGTNAAGIKNGVTTADAWDNYDSWYWDVTTLRNKIKTSVKDFWDNILTIDQTDFNNIKSAVENGTENYLYDINGDGEFDIFDIQAAINKK